MAGARTKAGTARSRRDATFFETPAAFARWLRRHHRKADQLWVGYYKKGTGRPGLTWPESVREALRFGWIDGLRHSIDDESYRIRFTPRKRTSTWSRVNIRMVEQLIAEGRMQPAGLAAYAARSERRSGTYTYEQEGRAAQSVVEPELKRNPSAWAFFEQQPPWYRRTSARWVMAAKREQTRQRRLAILIADSANGRTIAPLTRNSESTARQAGKKTAGKKK